MSEGCVIDNAGELVGILDGENKSDSDFEGDNRSSRATGKRTQSRQACSEFNATPMKREREMGSDSVLDCNSTLQMSAEDYWR